MDSELGRAQLLLWLGQRLHPSAPLYNMALAFEIGGSIEPSHFGNAFNALLERSDALRTVFEERAGEPAQRVLEPFVYALQRVDLSKRSDPDAAARSWIATSARRRLDAALRTFDTALLELAPDRWIWYLNQHHLITDAWSTALVYRRVAEFYERSLAGDLSTIPALPAYRTFLDWERVARSSARADRLRAHWEERLASRGLPIRLYGKSASSSSSHTERETRDLGPVRSRLVRALAESTGRDTLTANLSRFNVFAAALLAYLHRVGGERRPVIGTPSHNRPTAAFRDTIGLFIEVFPFGVELDEDETFLSLLAKVQSEAGSFLRHAQPGTCTPEISRAFTVVLNFIHVSFPRFAGMPVRSEWVHPGHGDSRHQLRVQVHDFDAAGSFVLHFDFNAALFDAAERSAASDHFVRLLDAMLDAPVSRVRDAPLVTPPELVPLIGEPDREAPAAPPTVLEMFDAQVRRSPTSTALHQSGRSLSYSDLDRRAAAIARALRDHGVVPGAVVGVYAERSIETVVALMAVLEAGAAFLPVVPADPPARVAALLQDAGVRVVLAQAQHAARLPATVDVLPLSGPAADADGDVAWRPRPRDAAYVLYTSGSTGKPKGVVVEHGALAHYVAWARDFYLRGEPGSFPLFTSLAFDLTVTSIFVPLASGGKVVVYDDEVGSSALARVVEEDVVDVIKLTPSHLALLRGRHIQNSRIRTLIFGGEDLKTEVARAAVDVFGDVAIFNEYGPTEATVGCMIHRFDAATDNGASVPIGHAAAGARIYVLDAALHPVPPGVIGEIHVAGPGLARGYLKQPDLTSQRFVPDPFRRGERMYRTGDLGRVRPDGIVEYLGRSDEQVKIRGARVELAEVEAALLEHAGVSACVVDAVRPRGREALAEPLYCVRCALPSNVPGASYDAAGVCRLCRAFDHYGDRVASYFRTTDELRVLIASAAGRKRGEHDCLMLLSGGKDSTYALYRLVETGARVLAFTLDNGFISEQAKTNIRRVCEALDVEHVFGATPAMNAIFVDSLQRYSNVCNGCFKTIYTLGARVARERGIPLVMTGLSRGQLFETRLTEELFRGERVDVARIDATVLEARKRYHRADDAVARLLDTREFHDDALFETIEFVDFYRYCDVGLDEMLAFLAERAPWIRPSDTGRSSNCLLNVAGIAVHRRERGYHNYALPYSWDVRMGHKTRDAALRELNDEVDDGAVRRMLAQVGYDAADAGAAEGEAGLVAYYVAAAPLAAGELRAHLAARLPAHMVPASFIRLEELPLTPNGKVNRAALPASEEVHREVAGAFVPARTREESALASIWAELLRVTEIGVHDNFFELGGDSITAIRITARANEAGFSLKPDQIFRHQTVAELAAATAGSGVAVLRTDASGPAPLAPIQRWFFDGDLPDPAHWNQHWSFELTQAVRYEVLADALRHVAAHHDALRLRFARRAGVWEQWYGETVAIPLDRRDLAGLSPSRQDHAIDESAAAAQASIDLERGPLLRAVLFQLGGSRPDRLLLVAHHLVADGVSWGILLEDLESAYRQIERGDTVRFPPKTTAYGAWADRLAGLAAYAALRDALPAWLDQLSVASGELSTDFVAPGAPAEGSSAVVSSELDAGATALLLRREVRSSRARTDDRLLTALSAALAPLTRGGPLRADVEAHGRDDIGDGIDVSRTVGWFTALMPVVLDPRADAGAAIGSVRERSRGLPGGAHAWYLMRYAAGAVAESRLAALPPPQVLFNYLGRMDQLPATVSLLRPAGPLGLSRGVTNPRRYPLEVAAWLEHDRLRVDWSYSRERFHTATIEAAAARFIEALRGEEHGPRGVSADFPLARLDNDELNRIAELLRRADAKSQS